MTNRKQSQSKAINKNMEKTFVPNVDLDEEDRMAIDRLLSDPLELMEKTCGVITEGYKVSCSMTSDGGSYCATMTGSHAGVPNSHLILSAFAATSAGALACLMYKHYALYDKGMWPEKKQIGGGYR